MTNAKNIGHETDFINKLSNNSPHRVEFEQNTYNKNVKKQNGQNNKITVLF